MDFETLRKANEISGKLSIYNGNISTFRTQQIEDVKPASSLSFTKKVKGWLIERRGDAEHQCGVKSETFEPPHGEFIGYLHLDSEDMNSIYEMLVKKRDRIQAEFDSLGGKSND